MRGVRRINDFILQDSAANYSYTYSTCNNCVIVCQCTKACKLTPRRNHVLIIKYPQSCSLRPGRAWLSLRNLCNVHFILCVITWTLWRVFIKLTYMIYIPGYTCIHEYHDTWTYTCRPQAYITTLHSNKELTVHSFLE